MRSIYCVPVLVAVFATCFAQQPQPEGSRFQQRLNTILAGPKQDPPSKNYQIELQIERGGKVARYKVAVNSGSVSTELIDRLVEQEEGTLPRSLSFHASLTPMERDGAEVAVSLTRHLPFRTTAQLPGGSEKEVTQFKAIPLSTKVAVFPEHPVIIFDDGAEKITLVLSSSDRGPARRVASRNACINNLRMIDGAKEQWALEKKKAEDEPVEPSEIAELIRGGLPRCPEGGSYALGNVGAPPTCSIEGHAF